MNLSDLDEDAPGRVMSEREQRRDFGLKRVFGRRYMELRRLTETGLRELFVDRRSTRRCGAALLATSCSAVRPKTERHVRTKKSLR